MLQEHKDIRKNSILQTREKRKSQVCKSYTLKIDNNHLSKYQKNWLKLIFLEAKWFYNTVLNQDDVFDFSIRKIKIAQVKVIDKIEDRKLTVLSSQMKAGLHIRICNAIKVLSKLKKASFTIGRLKFKPEINSIDLPQYDITWKIENKKVKIQGLKKSLKVLGLDQIPNDVEFANAKLIRNPSGYYIQVSTFQSKQPKIKTNKYVGIDFGIKDSIVTSDGEKFNVKIKESKRLKRNQLYFSKKKKGSKNRYKQLRKIKKEYEKISNQKNDIVNKLISHLKTNYDEIYIQDENIKGWHKGLFGRQVKHSALGAIKSKLKSLESTYVISKWEPTTKLCPICGTLNKLTLSDRIYKCDCGYTNDRDIHAAQNILIIGQNKNTNSVMERNSTTVENSTSELLVNNNLSYDSLKQEAYKSLVCK